MEYAFTSPVGLSVVFCDVLYTVLYVRVSCFVVRGRIVSRRYINVCNCDMFNGTHGGCVCFMGELGFLYSDDIRMCIVNKQFELLEFVFDSVYVDLQYDDISLTFTSGSMSLWCVCSDVVVFCLSVRLLMRLLQ